MCLSAAHEATYSQDTIEKICVTRVERAERAIYSKDRVLGIRRERSGQKSFCKFDDYHKCVRSKEREGTNFLLNYDALCGVLASMISEKEK